MSGRRHRQKGDRFERQCVALLRDAGLPAARTPLSGSAPGKFGGFDVSFPLSLLGRDIRIECKHHGEGFKRLYSWLYGVDMLLLRSDHNTPLVVMPLALAIDLINAANANDRREQ